MLTVKSKQAWMKSAAQMKLNPSPNPTKSDFTTQVISPIEDGFIPSERTDLVEKEKTSLSTCLSFSGSFELNDTNSKGLNSADFSLQIYYNMKNGSL